jgi:hypothetical protein
VNTFEFHPEAIEDIYEIASPRVIAAMLRGRE